MNGRKELKPEGTTVTTLGKLPGKSTSQIILHTAFPSWKGGVSGELYTPEQYEDYLFSIQFVFFTVIDAANDLGCKSLSMCALPHEFPPKANYEQMLINTLKFYAGYHKRVTKMYENEDNNGITG